jgi:hypothetical protein
MAILRGFNGGLLTGGRVREDLALIFFEIGRPVSRLFFLPIAAFYHYR